MKRCMGMLALAGLLAGGMAATTKAQVLYDGGLGTAPTAQGWGFLALPALAPEGFEAGWARLDTTVVNGVAAGWSRVAPAPLDRVQGFAVEYELELTAEAHVSENRAGLSLIVLASDKRGIEIGIWGDRIWAQADSPMFTQAEGVAQGMSGMSRRVRLEILGGEYRVAVDGTRVLSGAVRDYTPFTGPIDPYETPNFLFVGDNTTSARASFRLRHVQILPVAPPAVPSLEIGRGPDGRLSVSWDEAGVAARLRLEARQEFGVGEWVKVAGVPEVVGTGRRVWIEADGEERWYRLGPDGAVGPLVDSR